MHAFLKRWPSAVVLSLVLSACHSTPNCIGDDEYTRAIDRSRLDLPANVRASERMAPLVIPPPAPDAEVLDPEPACLDEPPSYHVGRHAAAPQPAPASGGG
jgi:hypothetical protein